MIKKMFMDTTPEVEKILVEGFQQMPAWRKLQSVAELNQLLHNLALEDIRARHPSATAQELRLYLVSRWIPPELMKEAFGWDVETKGY